MIWNLNYPGNNPNPYNAILADTSRPAVRAGLGGDAVLGPNPWAVGGDMLGDEFGTMNYFPSEYADPFFAVIGH